MFGDFQEQQVTLSGSISHPSLALPLLGLPVNYSDLRTQTWTPHTVVLLVYLSCRESPELQNAVRQLDYQHQAIYYHHIGDSKW